MKKTTIKNEYRKLMLEYPAAQEAVKEADKKAKALKKELAPVMTEFSATLDHTEKTDYTFATMRKSDETIVVVYKETTEQGAVDWEQLARELGATDAMAEAYRKASTTRTTLEKATEAQTKKVLQG